LVEEGGEGEVGNLDDLEPEAGDITECVTVTIESRDQDLVVLLDEVEATVVGHTSRDLLAVLETLATLTILNLASGISRTE